MTSNYDEAQRILNSMADAKMAMNSYKGDIEDIPAGTLIQLLRNEVGELEDAVFEKDIMHIIEEAADAQNYLIALVYQQILIYRGRRHENK